MAKYIKNEEIVDAVLWSTGEYHDSVISISLSKEDEEKLCPLCGNELNSHGQTKDTVFQHTILSWQMDHNPRRWPH